MKNFLIRFAFITISALCFFSFTSSAQVKVAPVAGIGFSDVVGDYNSDGLLFGYHFGAAVNLPITHYLMFEPQVLYSRKGAKGKSSDLHLTYIEIPAWFRYQLSSGLHFNAGAYAGLLINAKAGDTDVKDAYKSLDAGLAGALGYQMKNGLGFSAGYEQGLVNIGEDIKSGGNSFEFEARSTCIKISVSYMLGGQRD